MWSGSLTPLTGNAIFTGPPRMSNLDDNVVGAVISDQGGTLHIQQSTDPLATDILTAGSANWDIDKSIVVTGNTVQIINEVLVLPYWRLKYVNGASAQGSFRLNVRTWSSGDF